MLFRSVLSEDNIPQPGTTSGSPKKFKEDAKPEIKYLTISELIHKHPDIPYYKDVLNDYDAQDYSWDVTKKVLEYANYLKANPDSINKLPPIIFIDNKINDGAHRTSALWLLKNKLDKDNNFWNTAKLKVLYYKQSDVL